MNESTNYTDTKLHLRRIFVILAFGLPFVVYLATLCPTVYLIDSGEFAINAYTLGICHPTGYPTYTLIGYMFTHLVPFGSVILRTNLMSAVIGAIASGLLFLLLRKLRLGDVPALVAVAFFAFSQIFWAQATITEVWTMQALFLILIITFFVNYSQQPTPKRLYALAFICGLALTHHMVTALLLPFVIILAYKKGGECFRNVRVLSKTLACGAAGLLPYAYLPVRAAMNPVINWGDPSSLGNFWAHITGKQFSGLMFKAPLHVVWKHFLQYVSLLNDQFSVSIGDFGLALVWLLPFGIYALWKHNRDFLGLAIAIWGMNVLWSINYSIPDIESYYIPSFIITAIIFGFSISWALSYLKRYAKTAGSAIATFLVAAVIVTNYSAMDRSDCTFVEDYVKDILAPLEENSLLISCGDGICSAIEYMQIIEGYRTDVTVIDRRLLSGWYSGAEKWTNIWYFDTVSRFDTSIEPIYTHKNWTRDDIKTEVPMQEVVRQNLGRRAIYYSCNATPYVKVDKGHHILKHLRNEYALVPYGLVHQVMAKDREPSIEQVTPWNEAAWSIIEELSGSSVPKYPNEIFADEIRMRYAQGRTVLGRCQLATGRYKQAAESFEYALKRDPEFHVARSGLGIAYFQTQRIDDAVSEWRKVIAANPDDVTARRGLAAVESMSNRTE